MGLRHFIGLHILSALSILVPVMAGAGQAATALEGSDQAKRIAVPSQPIETALNEFARQSGIHVVIDSRIAGNIVSTAVKGELKTEEALNQLLQSTGLIYRVLDGRTISVEKPQARRTSEVGAVNQLHLAQANAASAGVASGQGTENKQDASDKNASGAQLNEIIVTAQKREERIQDVPVPVAVISGETLAATQQLQLRDYYTRIPGLSLTPGIFGAQTLAIRGVNNGPSGAQRAPTVGIMIDDVPYGSSFGKNNGAIPEIDPGDLARVEVLRGPQGTLYGASSMGGLLKFVTTDPSTTGFAGRVEAGTSSVHNGADLGYTARGSVNVPLSDTIAIRASGFTRRDPGYIDNPISGAEGINEQRVSGGRLSALWRPSDALSLKVNALYQTAKADGSSDVYALPGFGDLEQNSIPGGGRYDHKTQAYSATLKAKLGVADLTAVTGYNVVGNFNAFDYSATLGPLVAVAFPGISGTISFLDYETKKFTQEVRLTMPLGARLEWLIGGFYTRERDEDFNHMGAINPATGVEVGTFLDQVLPSRYSEYAAFTDLTWKVTDRFDIQVGARQSRLDQEVSTVYSAGPFNTVVGLANPTIFAASSTKADAFTYLLTPRLKVSPDLLAYARLASGYRAGGPQAGNQLYGIPARYDPDKTLNYELGLKGDFLAHALSIDVSVYHIDWKDIQITQSKQVTPVLRTNYTGNGARAKSQGVELSIESRPLRGLQIAGWVAYNDATLAQDLPLGPSVGLEGNRLPFSSRLSANLSVDGEFPLTATVKGFVGATASYAGDRVGIFQPTPLRQYYPSFTKTDLYAGVRYESWTINLFVNNLTDERGLLTGGRDYNPSPAYASVFIQPRTFGLSLAKDF